LNATWNFVKVLKMDQILPRNGSNTIHKHMVVFFLCSFVIPLDGSMLHEGIGKVKQGSFKWNVNLCKITNVSKALA
jgi:hypothetical protein